MTSARVTKPPFIILGIEASRFVESLRLKDKLFIIFVSDLFEFNLNLPELNLPSAFPSQISRLVYEVYQCIAGQQHGC